MKRAIVTGATSLIGIALIKELQGLGTDVCAVVRPNSARKSDILKLEPAELIEAELDKLDEIKISADSCDLLFHVGWSSDFPNPSLCDPLHG